MGINGKSNWLGSHSCGYFEVQRSAMAQGRQKDYHDLHSKYREFYPGDAVLIKDLRQDKTWWPGTIIECSAPKSYVTVLSDGRVWKRHIDHLHRKDLSSAELSNLTVPKKEMTPVTVEEDEFVEDAARQLDDSNGTNLQP